MFLYIFCINEYVAAKDLPTTCLEHQLCCYITNYQYLLTNTKWLHIELYYYDHPDLGGRVGSFSVDFTYTYSYGSA